MTLTKQVAIDKIEVLEDGQIQVREITRILEDGVQLSYSYHRHVLAPGDSTTGEDASVKAVADVVHTPEVIQKFSARMR